ncbi:MAG TPA: hypothetical protein EYQ41_04205 [Micavibrio sp.]|nr:hypothetical protein [Micavibrio sp.]
MSNIIDHIFDVDSAKGQACRVAYSLNNSQPVMCSIISDEPLFYLDFGDEIEDEDDLEVFDFTDIEAGVEDLKRRITDLSAPVMSMDENSLEDRLELFCLNTDMATKADTEIKSAPDMGFLLKAVSQSRLAAEFIEFAKSYETKFEYNAHIADAQYDRMKATIYINPVLCREDQILLMARELRRVWQHRNGGLINPLTFQPDQAVLVNRAQIADLSVMMVRIAWELQLAGEKTVWERLEDSSMADLARAFARESHIDFRSLNNGSAQSAVFETWFLSERCRHEDRKLIQSMLADYQGYVFESEEASQNVTAELIASLGTMPFGKNYLAPYIGTITSDAIFTEIRDRSNANFLWFIKFEKTFRETEQELQSSQTENDDRHDLQKTKTSNKRFGDHAEKTQIITLPFGGDRTSSSKKRKQIGGKDIQSGENIVPFTGKQ